MPVVAAMSGLLERGVSNLGGRFAASADAARTVAEARRAIADFVGAGRASEIVFGPNMTTLTFTASRALAQTWESGDEIVVTRLDHDANVRPWVLAAEARGVTVRYADIDVPSGVLPVESVTGRFGKRTRLVAVTHASNALGTIVDVNAITDAAHAAGALCFVDAVHYAPHGPIDVVASGADFLTVSAYKFFGPHAAALYGRRELLTGLEVPRLRMSPGAPPEKWEAGTPSFESLAGVTAAVDYLADLAGGDDRRTALGIAMRLIRDYERSLSERFLAGLAELPRVTLYGLDTSAGRTPTFSIDVAGLSPPAAAKRLGERGIFCWSGHNYAVGVMEALDRLDAGGLVRIGFVHYNLPEEVDRVLEALESL